MNSVVKSVDGFQIGGAIPAESNIYIERQADKDFYDGLKSGKFCYVLNSRQMGKSSLRVSTIHKLIKEDIFCIDIDITPLCGYDISQDQFYGGFLQIIVEKLKIQLVNKNGQEISLGLWWKDHEHLHVLHRIQNFIENEILENISKKVIK